MYTMCAFYMMHSQAKVTTMNNKLQFSNMTTCATMIRFFFSCDNPVHVASVPHRSHICACTKHAAFVISHLKYISQKKLHFYQEVYLKTILTNFLKKTNKTLENAESFRPVFIQVSASKDTWLLSYNCQRLNHPQTTPRCDVSKTTVRYSMTLDKCLHLT